MTLDAAIFGVICIVAGAVIALGVGALLLRVLPRLQLRQTAYEDAPKTHRAKTGTPTMGGLAILAALLPALAWGDPLLRSLLFLTFACAAIGFVDDYVGVRFGRNRGLRARTKYLATALVAVLFMRVVSWPAPPFGARDVLFHSGTYWLVVPHAAWFLLGIIAITGTVHAVNLTDGLDGLAAGTLLPPLLLVYVIAVATATIAMGRWPMLVALGIGGCVGFFVYNVYPARMFMGDTGSLALGALLSGAAILSGEMLLLVLIGGVFVAEALSVIIQVTYFKATHGKRVFRMTPLHHHFELSGLAETQVTHRFWLASAALCALGLAVVR